MTHTVGASLRFVIDVGRLASSQVLYLLPDNPDTPFHPITAIRPRFGMRVVTLEWESPRTKPFENVLSLVPLSASTSLTDPLRNPYKKSSSRTPWCSYMAAEECYAA